VKKVLFVAHEAERSGASVALLRLLRWLRDATALDFEIVLLRGGALEQAFGGLAPLEVIHPQARPSLDPLQTLGNRYRASRLRRARCLSRVRSRIERGDVGLVFFNSLATAELFAKLGSLAVPVVAYAHECRGEMEAIGLDRVRALCARADEIFGVSRAAARDLRSLDGALAERIRILPGCVASSSVPAAPCGDMRRSLGIPSDALVVGGAGRLGWRKGTDLFVQLARSVAERDPSGRVRFVWFGEDPGGIERPHLQRDVDRLAIGSRVHFAGPTDAPEHYYADFDLFALTSREDPFPLVCLEAAQYALPVLCFEGAGGAPEFIGKEAGAVVPYLDVAAMADAVLSLAAEPDVRRALGAAAAERVGRDYTPDAVYPELLARLETQLGETRNPTSRRAARPDVNAAIQGGTDAPPKVEPVRIGAARPYWSVMIPTYQPSQLLEATLRSVLEQDPGGERMQIAVVDDGSTNGVAASVVEQLGSERIEYYGQTENRGLARNWNSCLEWSRGHWIHLLHQDDLALPGFYEALEGAAPETGAAFCRHAFTEVGGHWEAISPLEREASGFLENALARIAVEQPIQCPSIVVRRSAYEQLGGFRPDLCYALDWEMWIRIAACWPVWYEPRVLAAYRRSRNSEASRLMRSGASVSDAYRAVRIAVGALPEPARAALMGPAQFTCSRLALLDANRLWFEGDRAGALRLVRAAAREDRSLRFWLRLAYIAAPWLKHWRPAALPSGAADT
jgi:glycosyltransferase involved in cell wall biosynthesis